MKELSIHHSGSGRQPCPSAKMAQMAAERPALSDRRPALMQTAAGPSVKGSASVCMCLQGKTGTIRAPRATRLLSPLDFIVSIHREREFWLGLSCNAPWTSNWACDPPNPKTLQDLICLCLSVVCWVF